MLVMVEGRFSSDAPTTARAALKKIYEKINNWEQ